MPRSRKSRTASCKVCGKLFDALWQYATQKFGECCSPACRTKARQKQVEVECTGCGCTFTVSKSRTVKRKPKRFFHSKECEIAYRRASGAKVLDQDGYVIVQAPNHPVVLARKARNPASRNEYVREHRLVMEAILGRYLLPTERVIHINDVRHDNRPENLALRCKFHPVGHHS